MKISYVCSETNHIAIINGRNTSLNDWYLNNIDNCRSLILKSGGLLLRNFSISSTTQFNEFATTFSPELMEYTFRSSPRTKIGGKIYTSTEYPADRYIPLHNENSYTNNWPNHIFFYCVIPPSISGGETPLADSRRIYNQLDCKLIDRFNKHGLLYKRYYIPGIDLSWQEVFQTQERASVESYCRENAIDYIWDKDGAELITSQVVHASIKHPITEETIWFNQAHLFHSSAIDKFHQELIKTELGLKNMPRHCLFGNGEEINDNYLEEIRTVYKSNTCTFTWQEGDILLLDNILTAHGRNPYQGNRKILVAMS